MKNEIGSYEAKTRLPELLRAVQDGHSFTITNRGDPVARLVPIESDTTVDSKAAVEQMLEFMHAFQAPAIDIKALIEEGRD